MVTAVLVDRKIRLGEKLVAELDRDGFPLRAAFWQYLDEPDEWRLMIASALVDSKGPRAVYSRIHQVAADSMSGDEVGLGELSVISPKHPLVKLLKKAMRTGSNISGTRFSRSVIDGTFVEDIYIYRLE